MTSFQTILQLYTGSEEQPHGKKKPFVAYPVIEIQSLFDPSIWSYCPGKQNPVDLPTRGLSASQLRESHLWWKGPFWFQEFDRVWPENLWSKPSSQIVEPKEEE